MCTKHVFYLGPDHPTCAVVLKVVFDENEKKYEDGCFGRWWHVVACFMVWQVNGRSKTAGFGIARMIGKPFSSWEMTS